MRALGLSFGRKMKNSEIMVKQVLKQLERRGFETQFIRVQDLDIKPCTGCIACVGSLLSGRKSVCTIKDDFHILDDAIREADAVVVCAPVYCLAPSGLFKVVCDRMGPSHDLAFLTNSRAQGEAMGLPEAQLVDKEMYKPRACALLSVGGARTKNWTSLGWPQMYEICWNGMSVVDGYNAYAAMDFEHIIGNDVLMARLTKMGDNLAEALRTEGGLEKWYGDEAGVCPVCHCDLLTVTHNKTVVECPICGIEGKLSVENDEIKVVFPEAQQARSRLRYPGRLEHYIEIRDSAINMKRIPDLAQQLEAYK